ncbi:hypothetical protein [uncultured Oscillibacter sp.]|uniref:hypothetical protein n=1 Tax=uncultured Oscillibacter sp. TaxID=876091 RepID=UPI0025F33829|nr:hypothetical protein [uncultured Oscillibacter sp.]
MKKSETGVQKMENNTFKSVAFGGFAKQDVIDYIEKMARESAAAQDDLRRENEELKAEAEALRGQVDGLKAQLEVLNTEHDRLTAALEEESSRCKELEPSKPEAERLAKEVERLRPDAEAYAQFREQIGAIECEARKRAADLEESTHAKLRQLVEQFREQYTALTAAFDATASHVNGELRKVEVTLTQLPRALDHGETELKELASVLERHHDKS